MGRWRGGEADVTKRAPRRSEVCAAPSAAYGGPPPHRFATGRSFAPYPTPPLASTASIRSATMLVILIMGFTAGPEVSL
jgi:hypothetical protein